MNRTNRTSVFRLSGVQAGVRALPDHRAPYIRGGMGHKSALICNATYFSILLYYSCLPTTTRPDRADTEEKGRTEATPHFLPLVRQTGLGFGAGGVTGFGAYPTPPLWGSLPSKLSLREGGQTDDAGSYLKPYFLLPTIRVFDWSHHAHSALNPASRKAASSSMSGKMVSSTLHN